MAYLQRLEAWQLASDAYGRYVQLAAGVDQAKAQVEQLDEQIDAAEEQADESAEQRAQQERFTNEQEDLGDEQKALGDDQEELADAQSDLAEEQGDIADVRAKPIRVSAIAKVSTELAPSAVTQIDGIRAVTLTATPDVEDLGALTQTVQSRLDGLPDVPAGVTVDLGGASDDQADAFRELGVAMLLAIVLVFLIMVATFRSLVQPLVLLTSIPFAATGALIGLLVTDTALGVPAMVGLLMLIGIVVTNAIVLIDLINKKRETGRGPAQRGHPRRPAAAAADHHDRHRDHLRADPDGPRPDRRRGVHLPAAGRGGDRRPGLLDRADPAAGAGALHPGREPRREEAAPRTGAPAAGRRARPGLTLR